MGTLTLWDRIQPWLRHPLGTAAATIAFSWCDRHGFEIHVGPDLTWNEES